MKEKLISFDTSKYHKMRSIEYLIDLYPDKTGRELLAIQEQDKLQDEKEHQEQHKVALGWIEDINTNTGYFRGRFGCDQRFYYKVTNAELAESGAVMCDVEKIVVSLGSERGVVPIGESIIEKRKVTYANADRYVFNIYERVTEKEWNEISSYLENISQFWETYNKK